MLTLATLGHTKRQNRFQIFGYALCEQYLYGQWFIPFNVSHKTWSEVFVRLCSLSNETEENCQFSPDETTVRMDGIITAYNVSVYTYDLGGSQCVHTCVCLWERDWAWGLGPVGHCHGGWDATHWSLLPPVGCGYLMVQGVRVDDLLWLLTHFFVWFQAVLGHFGGWGLFLSLCWDGWHLARSAPCCIWSSESRPFGDGG